MLFFIAFCVLAAGLIFTQVPAPWNSKGVIACGIIAIVLAAIAVARGGGLHVSLGDPNQYLHAWWMIEAAIV